MASVIDVTERKLAQDLARAQREQLQATSRLVAVGEMASTLAHELNQPLAVIASFVAGALNRMNEGNLQNADLQRVLETTAFQARRAGKIVKSVHEFVRRRPPRPDDCDINRVTESALAFLRSEARQHGVKLDVRLDSTLPVLQVDSVLIEQVVLNIAKNGIEAMSGTPAKKRELKVRTQRRGDAVQVSISDFGCGVTPDIEEKLFAPFFTTKDEGMGMGLNICRSIVEYHSGKLWFDREPAGGTSFHFLIPFSQA
jgi:two-component system sensor histidine kinase DctS